MLAVGKYRIDFVLVLILSWAIYSFSLCIRRHKRINATANTTIIGNSTTTTLSSIETGSTITVSMVPTGATSTISQTLSSISTISSLSSVTDMPASFSSSMASPISNNTMQSSGIPPAPASASTLGSTSSGSPSAGAIDGSASYYTEWKTSKGSCGTIPSSQSFIAAVNPQYMPSKCNQCIMVYYQGKSLKVTATDTCPSCPANKLDLGDTAFQQLDSLDKGILQIKWEWVAC